MTVITITWKILESNATSSCSNIYPKCLNFELFRKKNEI